MHISGSFCARPVNVFIGKLLGVGAFTVLLCFSALIRIPLPFTPVPITLQNMAAFLAGAVLGPSLGLSAVLLYLSLGMAGAPLFANTGAGFLYLFGPTGGYLFGFMAAAWLIGCLTRFFKTSNFFALYAIMLAGVVAVYVLGGLWLFLGIAWSAKKIFFLGIAPFIAPDAVKAFLAAVLYKSVTQKG